MIESCPYPGCTWQGQSRPYARKRDGVPSVSTIAHLCDDQTGMVWTSAMIAATTAVHHHEAYAGLSQQPCSEDKTGLCAACRFLRSEHTRVWQAKAALGTHAHHLISQLASGEEVETEPDVDGYIDAWEKFEADCAPEWLLLERTVAYNGTGAYRGTIDFVGYLTYKGKRHMWLGDWKTGRVDKNTYETQTLQLAGYRNAQHVTSWVGGKERLESELPWADKCGVIALSSDGSYRLVELPVDERAWTTFQMLRRVWSFQQQMKQWAKEHDG